MDDFLSLFLDTCTPHAQLRRIFAARVGTPFIFTLSLLLPSQCSRLPALLVSMPQEVVVEQHILPGLPLMYLVLRPRYLQMWKLC